MTQHDEGHDEGQGLDDDPGDARWIERARAAFNPPPPPPVEAMWAAIEDALERDRAQERPGPVLLPEDPAVAGNGRPGTVGGAGEGRSVEGRWAGRPAGHQGVDAPSAAGPIPIGRAGGATGARRGLNRGWSWAAAAVLLLTTGVIMGRWSMQGSVDSAGQVASTPSVTAPASPGTAGGAAREGAPSPALVRATREHLDRSEAFLVGLRSDASRGTLDPAITAWAETLLSETRLLLDSRAGADGDVAPLLRDLEWILVQVTALPVDGERRDQELRLLNDGIDEQDVLFRMRAAEPLPGLAGAME